jgi:hypothetical protein
MMATTKKKQTKETTGKALESMNLKELRREYHLVFGLETTSTSKESIRKKITSRRSELAQERAARRAEASVERDPRLPDVGTVLEREHGGKKHRVTVGETGFVYLRQTYSSLSTVAKVITGCNWNGFGFFGLLGKKTAEAEEAAS